MSTIWSYPGIRSVLWSAKCQESVAPCLACLGSARKGWMVEKAHRNALWPWISWIPDFMISESSPTLRVDSFTTWDNRWVLRSESSFSLHSVPPQELRLEDYFWLKSGYIYISIKFSKGKTVNCWPKITSITPTPKLFPSYNSHHIPIIFPLIIYQTIPNNTIILPSYSLLFDKDLNASSSTTRSTCLGRSDWNGAEIKAVDVPPTAMVEPNKSRD